MNPFKAIIEFGLKFGLLHSTKRQHSTIEDALETEQYAALVAVFAELLNSQYSAIDPARVLRGQDLDTITAEQLLPLVSDSMPPSSSEIDYDTALLLLLAFSGMGQQLAIEDMPEPIPRADEIEGQEQARAWVIGRLNALLDIGEQRPYTGKIDNPALPHGIDQTTINRIAALIIAAIKEAEMSGDTRLVNISSIYDASIGDDVAVRAGLIAENNAATSLSSGQWVMIAAVADQVPVAKTWLRTRSRNPRDIHLNQVGVTVPFGGVFPSGDTWSQELPNCKCGIKVTYASGNSGVFRG